MFRWHVLLLSINKAKLALLGISLALQLLPLAGFLLELVLRHDRCRGRYARRSHGRGRALTSLLLEVHRSLGCLGMGNHLRCLLGLCLHLSRKSSVFSSLPEKSLVLPEQLSGPVVGPSAPGAMPGVPEAGTGTEANQTYSQLYWSSQGSFSVVGSLSRAL